jgi:hypothetical protein
MIKNIVKMEDKKMNKETLNQLIESENLRVRAVAELARNTGKSFTEAEKLIDNMINTTKRRIRLQEEIEAAIDAEFNI